MFQINLMYGRPWWAVCTTTARLVNSWPGGAAAYAQSGMKRATSCSVSESEMSRTSSSMAGRCWSQTGVQVSLWLLSGFPEVQGRGQGARVVLHSL